MQYLMVCAGTCWYIPAYTGIYWYIPAYTVHSDTRISLRSASGYNMVQGRTGQYNEVPDGVCWYMLVYTSIYWYILVYTSMYCDFRHKDFFEIFKWIQHGTRQDKA
jgi:hypothetical protein